MRDSPTHPPPRSPLQRPPKGGVLEPTAEAEPRPVCVLRSDTAAFKNIELTRECSTVVIGRSRSVDYRIDHPQVSGLQCTVRLEDAPGQRAFVTDSSTNGTFVNGLEVSRGETKELPVGSTMTILVASVEERDGEFGKEIPCFRVEMRFERPRPARPTVCADEDLPVRRRSARKAEAPPRGAASADAKGSIHSDDRAPSPAARTAADRKRRKTPLAQRLEGAREQVRPRPAARTLACSSTLHLSLPPRRSGRLSTSCWHASS